MYAPLNWDDLRIVAAIRDAGSYAGAGEQLGLNETTVARRLSRIEQALGAALFRAVDGARRPTADCEAALAHIQEIERRVASIAQTVGAAPGVSGRFRIAATRSIASEILAPGVAALLSAHPGLALEFLTGNENVRLDRWETDFALRLRKPEAGGFTIQKLGEIRLYLIQPADAADAVVCSYPAELEQTPESRFLAERFPMARCVSGDAHMLRALIRSGGCAGVLPEPLCADMLNDPALSATLLDERREVWLLSQSHLRRNPAARLVADWLRSRFAAARGDH